MNCSIFSISGRWMSDLVTRLVTLGLVLLLVAACETNPYDDSDVDIKPPDSSAVLSVEHEEDGDLVCVIEKSDPTVRYCVPRVHEEDS